MKRFSYCFLSEYCKTFCAEISKIFSLNHKNKKIKQNIYILNCHCHSHCSYNTLSTMTTEIDICQPGSLYGTLVRQNRRLNQVGYREQWSNHIYKDTGKTFDVLLNNVKQKSLMGKTSVKREFYRIYRRWLWEGY